MYHGLESIVGHSMINFKVIAIIVLSMMWLGYFVVLGGYYSVRR